MVFSVAEEFIKHLLCDRSYTKLLSLFSHIIYTKVYGLGSIIIITILRVRKCDARRCEVICPS